MTSCEFFLVWVLGIPLAWGVGLFIADARDTAFSILWWGAFWPLVLAVAAVCAAFMVIVGPVFALSALFQRVLDAKKIGGPR